MRANRLKLESFEPALEDLASVLFSPVEIEELRLAGYEAGFAAGWEDCSKTREAEEARVRSDLGQNLQQMSFTYHEARKALIEAFRPLLAQILLKLLPQVAQKTLPHLLVAELDGALDAASSSGIVVFAHPGQISVVQDLLAHRAGLPIEIRSDAALAQAEAYLRFADAEVHFDLSGTLLAMSDVLERYFSLTLQEVPHG